MRSRYSLTVPARLGVLCVVVFGLGLLTLTGDWRASPDNVFYLSTSWSLAHGEGYAFLGQPFTKYPAGFALLLAPLVRVCGFHFFLLHAYLWAWAVAGIYFLGLWARRHWGPRRATWLTILVATNYFFWAWSCNFLLSEAPYFALSMATLYVADRWCRRPGLGNSLILGALVLSAVAVRVPGVALLAGLAGVAVWGAPRVGRRRLVAAGVIGLVVVGAFVAWQAYVLTWSAPGSDHYLREWQVLGTAHTGGLATPGDVVRWVGHLLHHNWVAHSRNILWIVLGSPYLPEHWHVPAAVVLGLILIGLADGMLRRRTFADYYLGAYVLMFFLWPYNEKTRFWMPVLPLLMMNVVYGLERVGSLLRVEHTGWRRAFHALVVVAWLVCLPGLVGTVLRHPGPEYGRLPSLYLRWVALSMVIAYLGAGAWLVARLRVRGATWPTGAWPARAIAIGLTILCVNNLVGVAYRTRLKHRNYAAQSKGIAWAQHLGAWLRTHTPPDAVVAAAKSDAMISVYGDRRAMLLERGVHAVASRAQYLVAHVDELGWLEPAASQLDLGLRQVFRSGPRAVFRLERLRASRPPSPDQAGRTGT